MKRRMNLGRGIPLVAFLMILMLAAPVVGQEKIDETRDLNKNATVKITNVSGSVSVVGWDKGKVQIKGILGEGTERLAVEGDKNRLEIRVVLPKHARNVDETHLEIRLPKACRMDVSTVSADITVEAFEGQMDLESVSGDVLAEGGPEAVSVGTVSGEIDLRSKSQEVDIESVSGDVEVAMSGGRIDAETVSGDLRVVGAEFRSASMTSVSGDIDFDGGFKDGGSFSFNSHSGDILLSLSGKISAEFDISTFSGDICSDFGSKGSWKSEFGPGEGLEFTVGSGDADVEIETFSGDVEIEKK